MTGEVDDLEARDLVALANRAGNVDGPAVPHEAVHEAVGEPDVVREQLGPPVVASTGALGLRYRIGMAEHVRDRPKLGCGAAMVGVTVAQDDPRDPTEFRCRGGDCAGHCLLTCVEDDNAAGGMVLQQINVRSPRHAAAQQPDALGDGLGRSTRHPTQARAAADGSGSCHLCSFVPSPQAQTE